MKITLRAKNIKLTDDLRIFVKEKIESLEKFLEEFKGNEPERVSGHPRIEAKVDIEKTTHHHRKGPFFKAECQIWIRGKKIMAEAQSEDLRLAITEVKDELQREIKKYKGKLESKTKRTRGFIKRILKITKLARFRKKRKKEDL